MANTTAAHLVPVQPPADQVEASPATAVPLPPVVLAPPRKPAWPTLAALAIAAGLAALGLGAWAVLADARARSASTPGPSVEWSLGVLADSGADRFPLRNAAGRITLVATDDGRAVLTLDGLGLAPEGSTYRAWVVPPGSATPQSAATFHGSEHVVPLERHVAPEALVAVTLEPAPGADRPSRPLRLTATRT